MAFAECWQLGCACALLAVAACGGGDGGDDGDTAPPEGYVRYETPPVTVLPGENGMWLQWVAEPADHDRNIDDLIGAQGPGGHHAILYTAKEAAPIGTTRVFENEDQADIQFVGGTGGEGADSLVLPEGVVFRVPAGRALVVQTHYLNASDQPMEGNSTIDVKFSDPQPTDRVARFFANASRRVSVPPNQDSTMQTSCVLPHDMPLLMYANHMHEMGMSITTTATLPSGEAMALKSDPQWDVEWTFNPDYIIGDPDAPLVLPAGTRLTTDCAWRNTTGETLTSPDEMCVFFAFFFGDKDATCADGTWREAQ
jgi:hypothetical protein